MSWGSRAPASGEGAGMGIEYQRVGGSNDDVFVDPFATADTDVQEPVMTAKDYGLTTDIGSSKKSASFGGLRGLPSSSSSGPALDHLSSHDIAAALSSNAFVGIPDINKAMAASDDQHRYLAYERRSMWGQASYNVGYSYFGGLALGGLYGCIHGLRTSPNMRARVLVNSVLNGSGRFGARAGNAAGVLAMVYTFTERQLEDVEVDKLPGIVNNWVAPLVGGRDVFGTNRADAVIPAAAAFATGVLFTLPRAMTMRGVDKLHVTLPKRIAVCLVGGLSTTVGVSILAVAGPALFGEKSPFRFA